MLSAVPGMEEFIWGVLGHVLALRAGLDWAEAGFGAFRNMAENWNQALGGNLREAGGAKIVVRTMGVFVVL